MDESIQPPISLRLSPPNVVLSVRKHQHVLLFVFFSLIVFLSLIVNLFSVLVCAGLLQLGILQEQISGTSAAIPFYETALASEGSHTPSLIRMGVIESEVRDRERVMSMGVFGTRREE